MKKCFLVIMLVSLFSVISSAKANQYLKAGTGFIRGEVTDKIAGISETIKENSELANFQLGIGTEYKNFDLSANFRYAYFDLDNADFDVYTLSLDANYLFKNSSKLVPYAGIGLNFNHFKTKIGALSMKESSPSFAYRIGVRTKLNDIVDVDLNVQQTTKSDCFDEDVLTTSGTIERFKGEYKDTSVNISLLFKF